MAKYRTTEALSYIKDGKVVSIEADRVIDIDDAQAEALGAGVAVEVEQASMFPTGSPVIPAGYAPAVEVAPVDPKTLVSSIPKPRPRKSN